jgi:Arc/MetJ-type ribon-helix-helix transcriptional regulator
MSIQIAVRLPDQLVKSLDELVDSGIARSRASVIERALLRELRYQRMLQEVEILNSNIGADKDLDALAQSISNVALDVD